MADQVKLVNNKKKLRTCGKNLHHYPIYPLTKLLEPEKGVVIL